MIELYKGDCLELMKSIPDKSVDMVLCDLPYGTTACKWDDIIPIGELWSQYGRILKEQGVVVLFGSEPFSSRLRASNFDWYKYDWIWCKTRKTGFVHAKNQPLKQHENISVFSPAPMGHESRLGEKRMPYNPQGLVKETRTRTNLLSRFGSTVGKRPSHKDTITSEFANYPTSLLSFKSTASNNHPTEKPVALLEYLIKTYTNPGQIVLDNTMGSGSTGVACVNTGRDFIGIELDDKYFSIAQKRIQQAETDKAEMLF